MTDKTSNHGGGDLDSPELDEILDKLWCAGWNKAKTPGVKTITLNESKAAIKAWALKEALECVGEDEEIYAGDWKTGDAIYMARQTMVRQEIRTALKHKFGGEA